MAIGHKLLISLKLKGSETQHCGYTICNYIETSVNASYRALNKHQESSWVSNFIGMIARPMEDTSPDPQLFIKRCIWGYTYYWVLKNYYNRASGCVFFISNVGH